MEKRKDFSTQTHLTILEIKQVGVIIIKTTKWLYNMLLNVWFFPCPHLIWWWHVSTYVKLFFCQGVLYYIHHQLCQVSFILIFINDQCLFLYHEIYYMYDIYMCGGFWTRPQIKSHASFFVPSNPPTCNIFCNDIIVGDWSKELLDWSYTSTTIYNIEGGLYLV